MGWAKYYEDNMSIYIGRMAVKESIPVRQVKCDKQPAHKTAEIKKKNAPVSEVMICPKNQNGRRGLELTFQHGVEDSMIRKLQMNGWWWSKSNACWCNLDTEGNRKYADALLSLGAKVTVVVQGSHRVRHE